jgi:hypothetical protein
VREGPDSYTVVLNDDGLSKLRISSAYRQALRKGAMEPGKAKEFIQDKLRCAIWLIRSIHQRQRTISAMEFGSGAAPDHDKHRTWTGVALRPRDCPQGSAYAD